jgi:hypothetical protein
MSLHQTITAAVLLTCLTAALAFSGAFSKTTTAQDLATLLKENPKVFVGKPHWNDKTKIGRKLLLPRHKRWKLPTRTR